MSETKGPRRDQASGADRPQATPRKRRGLAPRGDRGRIPRPLLVALLLVIAGGAYLFWPRGGGQPAGIGEQYTVVTADSTTGSSQPRSGSVDIDGEHQPLVPETPAGGEEQGAATGSATRPPGDEASRSAGEPADGGRAATEPTPAPPAPEPDPEPAPKSATRPEKKPEPPAIQPRASGPWALQVGAFQDEANADGMVQSLAARDVDAHVRAAGTSSGDIVYRVWVGWFPSRDEATAYAAQERQRLGEAFPVHR